jgi:hypothetical protein
MSIPVAHNLQSRHVKATLEDILRHANDEEGRALNALDLPMEDVQVPSALASDKVSWQVTINNRLCSASSEYFPTAATRWALVSTSGTHSPWHIDTDGLCTMVEVQNEEGLKIWFVAVEREDKKPFSGVTTFLGDWDVENTNVDRWDVEAVVLTPGVKL